MGSISHHRSLCWEGLEFFYNSDIILAVFHHHLYYADLAGKNDLVRSLNPVWNNSYLGEHIQRVFQQGLHCHKKKAVWMKTGFNINPTDIKYIFSFLTLTPLNIGYLKPVTFEQCVLCGEMKWHDIYPSEPKINVHLLSGGDTQSDCLTFIPDDEEKTMLFSHIEFERL